MTKSKKRNMKKYLDTTQGARTAARILSEVYDKHKERIDKALHYDERVEFLRSLSPEALTYAPRQGISTKREFIQQVIKRAKQKNMSIRQAAAMELRSDIFNPTRVPGWNNFLSGLRNFDRAKYEEYRKFTQHKKVDQSRVRYEGDNTYSYTRSDGKRIVITHILSPVEWRIIFI